MKIKKRKKSSRGKGNNTVFGGARKKRKKSGHRGGKGKAGTGKRADQKKTYILKYDYPYFGHAGKNRKRNKDKTKKINLRDLEKNFNQKEINLEKYKILGTGQINKKLIITAREFSKSAKEKIEKAGGKAITLKKQEKKQEKKEVEKEEK